MNEGTSFCTGGVEGEEGVGVAEVEGVEEDEEELEEETLELELELREMEGVSGIAEVVGGGCDETELGG